jgi:hypothetical protein
LPFDVTIFSLKFSLITIFFTHIQWLSQLTHISNLATCTSSKIKNCFYLVRSDRNFLETDLEGLPWN